MIPNLNILYSHLNLNRFQWILDKGDKAFSITPLFGFVAPASELEICVTFEPNVADCLFKTKVTMSNIG